MKAKKYLLFFLICLFGGFVWGSLFHVLMSQMGELPMIYWETVVYGGGAFAVLVYLTFVILVRVNSLFVLQNKSGQKALIAHEKMVGVSAEERYFGEMDDQGVLPRTCEAALYLEKYGLHIAHRYMDIYGRDIPYAQIRRAYYAYGDLVLELYDVKLPLYIRMPLGDLADKLRQKGVEFTAATEKLFVSIEEKLNSSAYIEFQFCKEEPLENLTAEHSYWAQDSLLVHSENEERFMQGYGEALRLPTRPAEFDFYGVNYYDKEKTREIINALCAQQPEEYQTLCAWLKRAEEEFNGFYVLGL